MKTKLIILKTETIVVSDEKVTKGDFYLYENKIGIAFIGGDTYSDTQKVIAGHKSLPLINSDNLTEKMNGKIKRDEYDCRISMENDFTQVGGIAVKPCVIDGHINILEIF